VCREYVYEDDDRYVPRVTTWKELEQSTRSCKHGVATAYDDTNHLPSSIRQPSPSLLACLKSVGLPQKGFYVKSESKAG
jgi:hypothetical protein